jgi:Ion channel
MRTRAAGPRHHARLLLTERASTWRFEDWTVIDALYFSIVTLATVAA